MPLRKDFHSVALVDTQKVTQIGVEQLKRESFREKFKLKVSLNVGLSVLGD